MIQSIILCHKYILFETNIKKFYLEIYVGNDV